MEQFQESSRRGSRLALVAVALLVLLAIVAFASRSGFGHHSEASPSSGYVSYAFTAFLILFALMIPVAAYAFLLQAREGDVEHRRGFVARVLQNLAILFLCGLVAFIVIYLRHHHHFFGLSGKAHGKLPKAAGHGNSSARSPFEPAFQWTVFWIAVALLTAAVGVFALKRRGRTPRGLAALPEPTVAEALASSIGDAIDDLEAEPDARRAVIAAYARMEGVLARRGLQRRMSETPLEYLRRILLDLTTRADAVQRLTDLFEQAKFSRHEIDSTMKLDAIGALRTIRDDLRAMAA
jgi:cytochrome bd-type quinol oxidase subunit 2